MTEDVFASSSEFGDRITRCFYWGVYTVTTVGLGDVSVVTNGEKIFCCIITLLGGALSDAGTTAILSYIVSNRHKKVRFV